MSTRKVSFPNGKDCELASYKAVVISASRDHETHVYGGGGGGRIAAGGGRINEISIQSNVVEHYRVWIRYQNDNTEQELNLGNWGLTCREGHELTLLDIGPKKSKPEFEFIAVKNEMTNSTHFTPYMLRVMRELNLIGRPLKLGWIVFLLMWGGSFSLFIFLHDFPNLKSSWILMALGWFGVVPILPAILGGMVNRRCHAVFQKSVALVERTIRGGVEDLIKSS
ncbi:MAG: hypothetical protein V4607_02435 [Pseudomonadota bacterium]